MELNNLKVTSKNILLFGILFLILPNISALIISEIMYNPPSYDYYGEWIELYNDGDSDIDLSGWTLCNKNLSGGYIDHADGQIKNDNGLILPAKNYAVITDGGTGTEIYSTSSVNPNSVSLHVNANTLCIGSQGLDNAGETIALTDKNITINSANYNPLLGGNGNGNSLQICSSSWIEEAPTPGSANTCTTQIPQTQNQTQTQTQNNQNNNLSSTKPTIEINYLKNASLNQEFIFKIKLINFAQNVYDIKIDILSNGTRIANILNDDQWKSTNYYLTDVINQNGEKEFSIKIIEKFENADITIKIKDSNEKIEIFQGYKISGTNNEESNKTENGTNSEIIYLNMPPANQQNLQNKEDEISVETNLSSKDIKSRESAIKLNKNNYAEYILTAFVFLLAFLFLLKKIFKKKYQNEFKS